jgi:hypothetical protein
VLDAMCHASALIFAVKNRMEISLGVAIGEHLVLPYMQMMHGLMRCCLAELALVCCQYSPSCFEYMYSVYTTMDWWRRTAWRSAWVLP